VASKRWSEIRDPKLVNDSRVATYQRLLAAQERVAEARYAHGETVDAVERALTLSETEGAEDMSDAELFLAAMAAFVTGLGGRLEVQAVFPEETITVQRFGAEPGPAVSERV